MGDIEFTRIYLDDLSVISKGNLQDQKTNTRQIHRGDIKNKNQLLK